MIDLLFIELGAVVTEVAGPYRCTVEIFCDPNRTPTYAGERRVAIDFEYLLDNLLDKASWGTVPIAAGRARYARIPNHPTRIVGPSFPGAAYEGIVTIRDEVVQADPILAAGYADAPARPYEYHVIASVDGTGRVAYYHGFHAEGVPTTGDAMELRVAHAGRSHYDPARTKVLYDPSDTTRFYAGARAADTVVSRTRPTGAVYMTIEAAATYKLGLPKLPPGAGK